MKCRVWIADFDEEFSDFENYSEDEDEFFPSGHFDLYTWRGRYM